MKADITIKTDSTLIVASVSIGYTDNGYTKTEVDDLIATRQAALISGKNVKTVNGNSLLGSGNIAIEGMTDAQKTKLAEVDEKQDILVSGTNIKTVNGNSLLGSGNITIEGGVSGKVDDVQVNGASVVTGKVAYVTIPSSLPASDVSDWAKASTKPAYTASEITDSDSNVSAEIAGLLANQGALASLYTNDKSSLVSAINEMSALQSVNESTLVKDSGLYSGFIGLKIMDGATCSGCILYAYPEEGISETKGMIYHYGEGWRVVTESVEIDSEKDWGEALALLDEHSETLTSFDSKADKADLADAYDSATSYAVGDLCIYDNVLYKCTTATTGEWDSACWTSTTIGKENLAFSLYLQGKLEYVGSKTNGNIVLADGNGVSHEYMPATSSGDPMHYMYIEAGAEWNGTGADITKTAPWGDEVTHKSGCWYLNGLGDLTTDEMRRIYHFSPSQEDLVFTPHYNSNVSFINCSASCRTNIIEEKISNYSDICGSSYYGAFRGMEKSIIEVLKVCPLNSSTYGLTVSNTDTFCQNNYNIKHILGLIRLTANSYASTMFGNLYKLETLYIKGIKLPISFKTCTNLRPSSVAYMINNVDSSATGIVITLHATAYANAMADADVQTALTNHTNVSLASA